MALFLFEKLSCIISLHIFSGPYVICVVCFLCFSNEDGDYLYIEYHFCVLQIFLPLSTCCNYYLLFYIIFTIQFTMPLYFISIYSNPFYIFVWLSFTESILFLFPLTFSSSLLLSFCRLNNFSSIPYHF